MSKQDYTIVLEVDVPAQKVFNSINDIAAWWTGDMEGNSHQLNDEFTVHFGEVHVSTQKLVELIPYTKIVWLVTDSKLNFIKDQQEWNNTTISFEISQSENKTQITFTHVGLVPQIECYKDCSKGWDYFIKGSLFKLLTKGEGTPGL